MSANHPKAIRKKTSKSITMKLHFVKNTSNNKRFRSTVIEVQSRGAAEAGWLLVTGVPGVGKTTIIKNWALEQGAVWLTAKENWTVNYFIQDLAEALGVPTKTDVKKRDALIVGQLARGQIPIVIDEVERCFKRDYAILRQLRTFSDAAENVVVLTGMEDDRKQHIQTQIASAMEFGSRVFKALTVTPATLEDVRAIAGEILEVKLADDLTEEILRQSNGILRNVKNAFSIVERWGMRNKRDVVTLADMDGVQLCQVFQVKKAR